MMRFTNPPQVLVRVALSFVLATLAAGCGEERATVFVWDHFLDDTGEPSPAPETNEPEVNEDYDVERWGTVTGGDIHCAAASQSREAAFLAFGDGQNSIFLELGPGSDLRWQFDSPSGASEAQCSSREGFAAQVDFALFDEEARVTFIYSFNENGTLLPGRLVTPRNDPLAPHGIAQNPALPEFNYLVGRSVRDQSPLVVRIDRGGLNTFWAQPSDLDESAEFIGQAFSPDAVFVAAIGSFFGNPPELSVARFPAAFRTNAVETLRASIPIDDNDLARVARGRNRVAAFGNGGIVIAFGNRITRISQNLLVSPSVEIEGADFVSVANVDGEIYLASTENNRAVVRHFDGEQSAPVVFGVQNQSSIAHSVVTSVDGTFLFVWQRAEEDGSIPFPPSTTIDRILPL